MAHGLHGARTKDIAAEAGVNEALLYRHFASKDELIEAAVVEPLERAVAELASTSGEPPEADDVSLEVMTERTRAFLVKLFEIMGDVAPLLGLMLFGEADAGAAHYRDRLAPALRQIADIVRLNLDWWDHRPFDPDQLVRFVFGGVWFESTAARFDGRVLAADAGANDLVGMIISGLAPR